MTLLPLADAARLLGIHPKTLRDWLRQAHVPLSAHLSDARIKCLTPEQVEHLAAAHGRLLQPPSGILAAGPDSTDEFTPRTAIRTSPPVFQEEALLSQKLALLETRVAQLSQQLAGLALALLEERDRTVESRLSALETAVQERGGRPIFPPPFPARLQKLEGDEKVLAQPSPRPLNPAEQRARSRMPPLIEYSAQGTYVIVSAQEGELSLVPDSPQWFDWLASLSSFRFVGKRGRFSAHRVFHKGPTRYWQANRSIHQHRYKPYLGGTEHLTIDCLEQAAATLQAYVEPR